MADVARARVVNTAMWECQERFDPVRFTALNLAFHSVLFENCLNHHLLELVHRGRSRLQALRSSTFSYVPGRASEFVAEHEVLLVLVEKCTAADVIEAAAWPQHIMALEARLDRTASAAPHITERPS